ncbi:MAG: DNA polymerase III subunit delta [bacterium]
MRGKWSSSPQRGQASIVHLHCGRKKGAKGFHSLTLPNALVGVNSPRYTLIAMIILLYGDDTYRSRQRLQRLRAAFIEKHDPSGVNVIRCDGEKLTAEELLTHLTVRGFLTSKRFIAVENFLLHGRAQEQQAVFDVLTKMDFATDNILILWEGGDEPKKTKAGKTHPGATLWQSLATAAKVESFPPLEGSALTAWYRHEIEQRGGTIEKTALQQLLRLVGQDLWKASSEIDKLVHYSLGQPITEAAIDQLLTAPFDENIFLLTDALGQRDVATALRLLEGQFQNGAEPLYVLRMLAWHVRNLLGVRSLLDEGTANPRTIARDLGLHPFVAQKAIRQVSAFTLDDLRSLYRSILEIDQTIKSRSIDPRIFFTLLTVRLTKTTNAVSPTPSSLHTAA